ncbi:ATP-binding protein [Geobacillus stearothermophilus]|uniref:ATP-binding protein n=1 Tax=Geobacillus TaxID=129337 RepID=UPI002E1DB66F|nr:ATP-binding protein [Geobacillus stearothermophilus]
MEAAVTDKHIQLTRSIEPDVMIKSDPERIKQVIAILFENAIKYTNENGKIDLSLMKSKRHIVFSIKNTGKGIGKQDLPSQISIDTPIIQRVA